MDRLKHARNAMAPIVIEALAVYRAALESALGREFKPGDAVFVAFSHRQKPPFDPEGTVALRPLSDVALYQKIRSRLLDAGIAGEKLGAPTACARRRRRTGDPWCGNHGRRRRHR